MKKTVTKRFLAILMAFIMVCSVCNMPDNKAEAADASANDRYSKGYNISSILSQFQFFLSGNVTMNSSGHTVGAVVVGGDMSLDNTFGDAAIVPSYVKNRKNGTFGTAWHGKYPDKCNTVYYDTGAENEDKNIWVKNAGYINLDEAFASIKEQSNELAKEDNLTNKTDGNITCSGDEDIYVTLSYATFQNGINITVDGGVDWFKDHVLCISVTGVNSTDFTFDGYSKIKINGEQLGNKLKEMTGSDKEYSSQLNVSGMNLLWNFPDATGTITTQGLGGHLVAPSATINFQPGNYEGGVIAANITGGAEGHFYPMSKSLKTDKKDEEEQPEKVATADVTFSKKAATGSEELEGAEITLHYNGKGSLEEVTKESGPEFTTNQKTKTILWKSTKEPLKLKGLPAGEYTMVETGAPNGYKYAESIIFKIDDKGKVYKGTLNTDKTVTYETSEVSIIEMKDEAKAGKLKLVGTKKVTGIGAPTGETYTFVVKDEKGNQVATGTVTGAGEIVFSDINYDLKDLDKTYTYTITENTPKTTTKGMKYDDSEIKVTVTVKDEKTKKVDGKEVPTEELTVTYTVTGGGDIVFTNEYLTATGTFSKKAVTGGDELPGAKLKLSYKGSGNLENVTAQKGFTFNKTKDTITWTSGEEAANLSGLPEGEYTMTETGAPNGYKYSDEIYFKVKDGKIYKGTKGANGNINYDETKPVDEIVMLDEAKSGTLTLKGNKTVEGAVPTGTKQEYNFSIKDESGKEVATASTSGGDFDFTPIGDAFKYGPDDIGIDTHVYTVSEVKPASADIIPGMIYDSTEYTVKVSVKDEGKDYENLTVTYTVYKGNVPVSSNKLEFSNRYYDPAAAVFSKKAVSGGDELPGASLELTYTSTGEGKGSLKDVQRVSGPTLDSQTDSKITWKSGEEPLELSKLPNEEYKLHEEGAPQGYKYADDIYFSVKDSKIYKGELQSDGTVKYASEASVEPIEMIDEAKSGTLTLKGSKTLKGDNIPKENYNFLVKEGDTVVATASIDKAGEFTFEAVDDRFTYGPDDIGTHTYTVTEEKPSTLTEGMTYDTTVFTVTVTVADVEDEDNLQVTYTVAGSEDKSITFVNVYEKPKNPTTENPTTESPTTENPTTESPTTEQQTVVTPPTGNLEIVVRDEKTKDPVPNATVEIVYPDGHKEEAKTDEHGQITKNDTPIGEYTITVTKVPEGYDVSTGQSAKALVETNKTTRHIAEIVTKTTVTTDTAAKTGDSFEAVLPLAILIYSAAMMLILGYGKKNNR